MLLLLLLFSRQLNTGSIDLRDVLSKDFLDYFHLNDEPDGIRNGPIYGW